MARYTVKTATVKFQAYGDVEFTKLDGNAGYHVEYQDDFRSYCGTRVRLGDLVADLTEYLVENRFRRSCQSFEVSCPLVEDPELLLGVADTIVPFEPEVTETVDAPRYQPTTHDEAIALGFSFHYSKGWCYTTRPDGTEFESRGKAEALRAIADGSHLSDYEYPPRTPVKVYESRPNEFGYTEKVIVYWDTFERLPIDVNWIQAPLDKPAQPYLTQAKYDRDKHLMEF